MEYFSIHWHSFWIKKIKRPTAENTSAETVIIHALSCSGYSFEQLETLIGK